MSDQLSQDEYIVEGCGLPVGQLKDALGRYKVGIFHEITQADSRKKFHPIYTMKEHPVKGLPSAKQIYMNSANEYEAAIRIVGSWEHWKKLMKNDKFMNGPDPETGFTWSGLNQWREEKSLKEEAEAKNLLWKAAEQGNVQAQKLLYEGKAPKKGAGRPSNDKVKKEAREMAEKDEMVKEDLKRIKGLSVVK